MKTMSSYEDIGASLPCNHIILMWDMHGRGVHCEYVGRRSCIEGEKEWAKYGTLGYTTGKSRECRDGIID